MQYIHMNDDTYIIQTTQGPKTLTRKSFNFTKIKRMIRNNAPEEDIFLLLEPPKLTNGIYQLFLIPTCNQLYYQHFQDTEEGTIETYKTINGEGIDFVPDEMPRKLLGVYTSVKEMIADWPEYTI